MKNRKVRVWAPKTELKIGGKINWKGRGAQEIINILDELKKVGEVPTIRGVWYILVSKFPREISNTKTIYQSYDKITVACRDGVIGYPTIAVDAFADDTRVIIGIDSDQFVFGADAADAAIQHVKDTRLIYYVPRWYKQKNYCEFWLEKRAISKMYFTILRNDEIDRQVRIVPNNGWSSFTYVKENIQRLYRYWNTKFKEIDAVPEDKKTYPHIWIFYSGDCDPSGRRMDINLVRELMKNFRKRFEKVVMTNEKIPPYRRRAEVSRRMSTIHFMRIAVMVRQIPEFELEGLTDPEAEALLKLEGGIDPRTGKPKKGDPNTPWFKKMFRWYKEGKVFQIEIDAMYARREQFSALLLNLVDSKFDNEIYKEHVVKKIEVERDALTMRLRDKLVYEEIELPGWKEIKKRKEVFENILSKIAEHSFFMDFIFSTMFSTLTKMEMKFSLVGASNNNDDTEAS
jgi:hypothetical protein